MKNLTTEELAKTYYQAIVKASEAGNHKEVMSLFNELGNTSQEATIAAHRLTDENGEALSGILLESALAVEAWKGKKLTTTETYDVVDGKDFVTTVTTWENHSETTTVPVSECDYIQWYNKGLITQSELHNKLESLKKGN